MIVATGFAVGVGAYVVTPKRFVARAILNIEADYFQVPLVGDLVTSSHDTSEDRSQRETIIRTALSDDFLDQLGTKFNLFRYPPNSRYHALEREYLLKGIDYFNVGASSYQITMNARTGEGAYQLVDAVVNQIISTLISERQQKLLRARSAILANLDTLKTEMSVAQAPGHGEESGESLEAAEAKLSSLEQRFTSSHPSVVRQRAVVEQLRAESRRKADGNKTYSRDTISASRHTLEDLYDDLLRKYNYLNVVIDMGKIP